MKFSFSSFHQRCARGAAVILLAGSSLAAACGGQSPSTLIGSLQYPGPVAIDGSNAFVTTSDPMGNLVASATGKPAWEAYIAEVPIGGGRAKRLATIAGPPITGIAVQASTVYFACAGNGTVASLAPGEAQPQLLASGQHEPWAIAVDRTHVYFTTRGTQDNLNGGVVRVPLAGGPIQVIASGLSAPMHLALDDANVYVSTLGQRAQNYEDSKVVRIPKAGGAQEVVATSHGPISGLAADGKSVYWITAGTRAADGQVTRLDRDTTQPVMLASNQPSPTGLAIDEATVFWTSWAGDVRKVGKRGGTPTTIVSGQDRPTDIVANSSVLVWANLGKIDGERSLDGALVVLRKNVLVD